MRSLRCILLDHDVKVRVLPTGFYRRLPYPVALAVCKRCRRELGWASIA